MSILGVFGIVLLVLVFLVPAATYFAVSVPADVQYGNLFGANVIDATQGRATLTGIQTDLIAIYKTLNQTWPDVQAWNTTYNSFWPQDKTKDNSIGYEALYLASAIQRINYYQQQLNLTAQKSGTNSIAYIDLYNTAINNTRHELASSGGLDWAIKGAWYLGFAPAAAYLWAWLVPLEILLILGACVCLAKGFSD